MICFCLSKKQRFVTLPMITHYMRVTPFVLENVLHRLNNDILAVNKWFEINSMVANLRKVPSHVSWDTRPK